MPDTRSWIYDEVRRARLLRQSKADMLDRIRQFPASPRLIGHALIEASAIWDSGFDPRAIVEVRNA